MTLYIEVYLFHQDYPSRTDRQGMVMTNLFEEESQIVYININIFNARILSTRLERGKQQI